MMQDFTKVLEVDKQAYTVRVQAGLKVTWQWKRDC
jgi:hypothetical protein